MEAIRVALSFVAAINSQHIDKISEIITEDHVFVESDGSEVAGHDRMREGWRAYFDMVPDYRIDVEETFSRDNTVVLLGVATGTFVHEGRLDPENRWSVPAAWRVVVEGDKVSVWQLYVNNEPMIKILTRLGMA